MPRAKPAQCAVLIWLLLVLIHRVKVSHRTTQGYFGDVLPSQFLGLVPKKLILTAKANNTGTKWQKKTKQTYI